MKYLLSIFFLAFLCSCSSKEDKTPTFYFDEEKFMSEWNIWKSQDIKNYSFTFKGELPNELYPNLYEFYPKAKSYGLIGIATPMYPYEAKIAVKNGVMDSFEYNIDIIGIIPNSEPEYTSISDMYEKIYAEIKNHELEFSNRLPGRGCLMSEGYEIEYDQEFHYITRSKPIFEIYENDCIFETTQHEVIVSGFTISH